MKTSAEMTMIALSSMLTFRVGPRDGGETLREVACHISRGPRGRTTLIGCQRCVVSGLSGTLPTRRAIWARGWLSGG
jgi:hypothetical protein